MCCHSSRGYRLAWSASKLALLRTTGRASCRRSATVLLKCRLSGLSRIVANSPNPTLVTQGGLSQHVRLESWALGTRLASCTVTRSCCCGCREHEARSRQLCRHRGLEYERNGWQRDDATREHVGRSNAARLSCGSPTCSEGTWRRFRQCASYQQPHHSSLVQPDVTSGAFLVHAGKYLIVTGNFSGNAQCGVSSRSFFDGHLRASFDGLVYAAGEQFANRMRVFRQFCLAGSKRWIFEQRNGLA